MDFKLLLVDDEAWVLRSLERGIDWEKYRLRVVGTATDGIEALKLATELRPDVLITDLRMPGLDGLSLIEKCKNSFPSMISVVLSGYNEFSFAQRALRMQVFDYILKPIDEKIIGNVLIRLIAELKDGIDESIEKANLSERIEELQVNERVSEIIEYIEDFYQNEITLTDVADSFFMNASYLSTAFKKEAGVTFSNYLAAHRVEKAKQLIAYTEYSMDSISQKVGFSDQQQMARAFKRIEKKKPSEFRQNRDAINRGVSEES